jgi:hypothetical protein
MRFDEITTRARRGVRAAGAATLLAAGALAACSDFLSTDPRGKLTTRSFFQTPDHAFQATAASYSMLRNWTTHVFSWLGQVEIASDDADKGSVPGDAGFLGDMDNLVFDPGNLAFRDPWNGYYQGIYRANVAIDGIPLVDMDEEVRDRLIGENKFLRAYYYFHLVRAHGGVPLITRPLTPAEFTQPRASADEVYTQIELDLTDAIAVLPLASEYAAGDEGRATQGAAQAMLGQVHLYQQEYEEAYEQLSAVIESDQYELLPNYATIWTEAGEMSTESVFEIITVALEGGNNGESGGASQYAEVQGIRAPPNTGWGFNTPSEALEAHYEPGDPRVEPTILYPWEAVPDDPTVVVFRNPNMPNNRYNQKVYTSPDNPGGTGNSGVNIRRIRYADVLLMAAEAAARTGREPEARTWLNEVRERARSGRTKTLGFTEERLAEPVADVLGLANGTSRVFARFVRDPSPAYTAGLRSFEDECIGGCPNQETPPVRVVNADVITSVNGTAITDLASFYAAVEDAPGPNATVVVQRYTQPTAGTTTSSTQTLSVPVQALLPDVTVGGEDLITAIWAERRSELGMEQHRMFDLRRQTAERGDAWADAMFDAHGKTWEPRFILYPIPASEVAIAGLTQNPGY